MIEATSTIMTINGLSMTGVMTNFLFIISITVNIFSTIMILFALRKIYYDLWLFCKCIFNINYNYSVLLNSDFWFL